MVSKQNKNKTRNSLYKPQKGFKGIMRTSKIKDIGIERGQMYYKIHFNLKLKNMEKKEKNVRN